MAANKLTEQQQLDRRVLNKLAELGEQRVTEDAIIQKGTQLILPSMMTPRDAIVFLRDYIAQQEEETSFSRTFKYRPWDGAAALQRALVRVTGSSGIGQAQWSFFGGKQPPELRTVQIGVDQTLQVPWGAISVPMFKGTIYVGGTSSRELGALSHMQIECPRRFKAHIEGLWRVVEDELQQRSIYKGKAFDGKPEPDFLDLAGVDARQVIYSDDVISQLDANLWSVLKHTDVLRDMNIPRKRAVLLEGPYGTGKTLAAFLTAQVAVGNDWTFIYCRPGRDDLTEVMGTARLYQPSVVFFEDVDTVSSGEADRDAVTDLLDLFDGITAKNTEIMAVLTTNHPDRIHKAMVRPGRLDAIVHIAELDKNGIRRMVEVTVPEDLLNADLDYDAISDAMAGYLPSFVKEAIDRTMRYAISREGHRPSNLTTDDFVQAAEGLRAQLKLMEDAKEGTTADSLSLALTKTVREANEGITVEASEEFAERFGVDENIAQLTAGNGNGH